MENKDAKLLSGVSSEELDKYLDTALRVAYAAGDVIRQSFYKPKRISSKSSVVDCVTETDEECERIIVSGIKAIFPTHQFIAEESYKGQGDYCMTDAPTWIIDPIDGTNNFVHSIPFVCVSVALMIRQQVVVGVVHCPMLNETFHAVQGRGAFLNVDTKLQVSRIMRLDQACVGTEMGYDRSVPGVALMLGRLQNLLMAKTQSVRMFGTAAINMCFVAAGRIEVYYEGRNVQHGPKPWDFAAGGLIVREAGGICEDTTGEAFSLVTGRAIAACNQEVLTQVHDLIRISALPAQYASASHELDSILEMHKQLQVASKL